MNLIELHDIAEKFSELSLENPPAVFIGGGLSTLTPLAHALAKAGFPVERLKLSVEERRVAYDIAVANRVDAPEMLSLTDGVAWKISLPDNVSLIRGFTPVKRSDNGLMEPLRVCVHVSVTSEGDRHVFSLAFSDLRK